MARASSTRMSAGGVKKKGEEEEENMFQTGADHAQKPFNEPKNRKHFTFLGSFRWAVVKVKREKEPSSKVGRTDDDDCERAAQ